ncbi:MerR family transcriptional regulator [Allorhizobium undicola]|uniref:MerR family transcriptional regulator n=1 Tax=Allorhizobium undicola TaxID=78527 RepID=UPI003D326A2E
MKHKKSINEEGAYFTLSAVSAETGLSKLLLHAWERRYEAVTPQRTQTGRRLYTAAQVERLKLLKECTDFGLRISAIVHVPDDELRRLMLRHQDRLRLAPFLEQLNTLDSTGFEALLRQELQARGIREFCGGFVLDLLHEVGQLWSDGKLSVAGEHMASAHIRSLLGEFLTQPVPLRSQSLFLFATLSEEAHELGALLAAVMAHLNGFRVLYLGPGLPNDEIAAAALTSGARLVCLSSLIRRGAQSRKRIENLREILPRHTELWLGGPGFADLSPLAGTRHIADLYEFETIARLRFSAIEHKR